MAPKRRGPASVSSAQAGSVSPPSPPPKTVTIIPPTTSGSPTATSKTPSYLKFPLVVLLSFSLSAVSHTIYSAISGTKLDIISPDGNPQWQLYVTTAWRVAELAVGWFAGYDAHDVLSLTLLTHLPRLFLLNTYYYVPLGPLYLLQVISSASTVIPFLLLRPLSILHRTPLSPPSSDTQITVLTTLLSTLTYTLPYLILTTIGLLPRFLATYFTGLKTLELAHASTLPGVALLLLPLGYSAARFYLPAASSAFSAAKPTTYVIDSEFDPVTASLSQTLHRNIMWHLYLPGRTQETLNRVAIVALLTLASCSFWTWVEVEGTESVGATGWAIVWSFGSIVTGGVLGWVGGLLD